MIAVIIFVLILSFLVLIHEFGHYIMAKRGGIGVEEFGFGLPPRIWGKKIGETLYSVNWLPFGGFVKLVGEDTLDKKSDAKNSFQVKSLGRRMAVVLAGVFMNFAAAVLIFYIVLLATGFRSTIHLFSDHKFAFVNQSTLVALVPVSGSIAEKVGIGVGDIVIEANGQPIASRDDLQMVIRGNENKEVTMILENVADNKRYQVKVTPSYNESLKVPTIGVNLISAAVLNYETWQQKLFSGFTHSYNVMSYNFKVLGQIFGYSFRERDLSPVSVAVSGPVGIAAAATQIVDPSSLISILSFAAFLSLNLAIMNVLPIPALDGGRFFFLVIEAITRRRPHPAIEKWTHTVGFVVLIGLILLVTYSDILKIIK